MRVRWGLGKHSIALGCGTNGGASPLVRLKDREIFSLGEASTFSMGAFTWTGEAEKFVVPLKMDSAMILDERRQSFFMSYLDFQDGRNNRPIYAASKIRYNKLAAVTGRYSGEALHCWTS